MTCRVRSGWHEYVWEGKGTKTNPAPVEAGSLSHYLQGFIHPRWCWMSSINSISSTSYIIRRFCIYFLLYVYGWFKSFQAYLIVPRSLLKTHIHPLPSQKEPMTILFFRNIHCFFCPSDFSQKLFRTFFCKKPPQKSTKTTWTFLSLGALITWFLLIDSQHTTSFPPFPKFAMNDSGVPKMELRKKRKNITFGCFFLGGWGLDFPD